MANEIDEATMKIPAKVLIAGDEPRLLETRAVILTHFWAVSTALGSVSEAVMTRAVTAADVIVLCDRFPAGKRKRYIDGIRESSPEKILVQIDEIDSGPIGGLDAMVAVGSGPGALVATIFGLLTERGMPSKGWKSLESTLLDDVKGLVN
jgi:hypothetical protein